MEIMMVLAIFGVLMGAILTSMNYSRTNWQNADYQISRQEDARKAIDKLSWELKSSSPSWKIDSNTYDVAINNAGDQIDFYAPVFDTNDEITELQAVRYYMGGLDNAQLLRKQGSETVVVANNIDNVAAQKPFFAFNNTDHTVIDIKIPIIKNSTTFVVRSQSNLRNRDVLLDDGVTVEGIAGVYVSKKKSPSKFAGESKDQDTQYGK